MRSSSSSQLAKYEEFSKHELPRLVRMELEKLVSEEMQPLEESLKGKLVDIIRESQQSILDSFKATQTRLSRTGTSRAPSSDDAANDMSLCWSSEFSNKIIPRDYGFQSPNSLLATAEEIPLPMKATGRISAENNQPWAMFTPPSPLEYSGPMEQNLDHFQKNVVGGVYADSGYATHSFSKSSEKLRTEAGSSNRHHVEQEPQSGEMGKKSNDGGYDDDADLWLNNSFLSSGEVDSFDPTEIYNNIQKTRCYNGNSHSWRHDPPLLSIRRPYTWSRFEDRESVIDCFRSIDEKANVQSLSQAETIWRGHSKFHDLFFCVYLARITNKHPSLLHVVAVLAVSRTPINGVLVVKTIANRISLHYLVTHLEC